MSDALVAFVSVCFVLVISVCPESQCESPLMGEYLYVATIQYRFNETYCTGAIVSADHVLTTYDCVSQYNETNKTWTDRPPDRMIVAVGIFDLYVDMIAGQLRQGKKILKPPSSQLKAYNRFWTNLAIIEVDKPYGFANFDANLAIPMYVFPPWQTFKLKSLMIYMSKSPPKDCYVVGWGFVTNGSSVPSTMMQEIPITLKKKCNIENCTLDYCIFDYSEQTNICGKLSHNLCGGYRGNLLVCFGKVYGLVSVPAHCSADETTPITPTVVARLDEGLAFIHDVIQGHDQRSSVKCQQFSLILIFILTMKCFK